MSIIKNEYFTNDNISTIIYGNKGGIYMSYDNDIRQDTIMKYYFDNCYPKLDIYEKKDNEDSKQSMVKLCINYTEFLTFFRANRYYITNADK